jgi:benzoate membrane transport protein
VPARSSAVAAPHGGNLQPILAGLLAALVGYASSFTLLLAAFTRAGASPVEAGTALTITTAAIGLLNIFGGWRTRLPVSFAWSTPGAAFLATIAPPLGGLPELAGALMLVGLLITLAGIWRPFARAIESIPVAIASAMLAGILLTLCLAPVKAVAELPLLTLPTVAAWAIGLRYARRYAVPLAVVVMAVTLAATTHLDPARFGAALSLPIPMLPVFTLDSCIRIALPLFIITMASQNLPGIAVMQANGYTLQPAAAFTASGIASALVAPFGALTVNLAAITAAICAGPEAHPDPSRRWIAVVAAGCTYLLLAVLAGTAAAFVSMAPPLLIQAVAGLALFTSLASALAVALGDESRRIAAVVTFATAASGVTVLGIGAAFWALIAGLLMLLATRK